ncbi:hypothetical protein PF010_g31906 [Phytophthora fragariae]|uniref:Uncharacterized protein n=1 Tax=Phytophthora fragariae TaxID=53985 RepID=A0A6A4AU77_9STRA|nr:hypothetical protein PF003_g3744 [Phytophthora fragariae]KAE9056065.1 hypothetical protein PF010_g31906 [Phytophthora fragariae]KAE9262230.1 hypothetical protein PF001_g32135 [Phytophthora fragariae]KAE9265082.1 hypothetical protein PF008_g31956 [Phytophthora fragariae]
MEVSASRAHVFTVTAACASSSSLRFGMASPPSFRGSPATCLLSHARPSTVSAVKRACQMKLLIMR